MEEIERNFNEVKQQLTEEMNRNLELKQRLEKLQEEKNAADVRCTEMKQAFDEFMFSTDKRGMEQDEEDGGETLEEPVEGKIFAHLMENLIIYKNHF